MFACVTRRVHVVGSTHDFRFVFEILSNRLASGDAGDERWPRNVEDRPLDVAEERVVFDVFGIVGEHDVPCAAEVAALAVPCTSRIYGAVVLPVSLCGETVFLLVEESED